jgi:hypothetical protein
MNRSHSLWPSGSGVWLTGPVMMPVRKASSIQPQIASAAEERQ